MKFKSKSIPPISSGLKTTGKLCVVPNQSMSLEEILERFTRGEAVAVGQPVNYHESEDDLEKIQHLDLTEKEEYVEGLKETQKRFKKQEAKKRADYEAALKAEALAKIEAEEKQKKGDSPGQAK